jgi:1,4-dihydroxy-2-naphthoate octaprenyltransferase
MSTSTVRVSKRRAWIQAARPRVFTASYVPMGLAGVIALQNGVFAPLTFVLAVIGVMLLQTTANLVNEYADYRRGADALKVAGQGMALKDQVLTPQEVLIGAVVVTVLACLIGLYMLAISGPYLWLIGLGGVLVAVAYTAGPFPLAYHGLGEIAAGVFMGPMIVLGAYYVMDPTISAEQGVYLGLVSLPITFMVANILHANNIRDLDADRAANKRTLAVRFGREVARLEYKVLTALTYLSQAALVLIGWMPPTTLLTLLTLPEALALIRIVDTETDPARLHMAQGRTARLHGRIGLALVLGWAAWLLLSAFSVV